jgi:hypothetical protein
MYIFTSKFLDSKLEDTTFCTQLLAQKILHPVTYTKNSAPIYLQTQYLTNRLKQKDERSQKYHTPILLSCSDPSPCSASLHTHIPQVQFDTIHQFSSEFTFPHPLPLSS